MNTFTVISNYKEYLADFGKLYLTAFPEAERRDLNQLYTMLESENRMKFEIITLGQKFCGFCIYWVFDEFCYIEHLAIENIHRGKGLGSEYLRRLICNNNKCFLLEVEPVEDSVNRKRVDFYEKLDFKVMKKDYIQEEYRKQGMRVNLWIMSNGKLTQEETERHIETIRHEVYINFQN